MGRGPRVRDMEDALVGGAHAVGGATHTVVRQSTVNYGGQVSLTPGWILQRHSNVVCEVSYRASGSRYLKGSIVRTAVYWHKGGNPLCNDNDRDPKSPHVHV